jgi:hypothetical protein
VVHSAAAVAIFTVSRVHPSRRRRHPRTHFIIIIFITIIIMFVFPLSFILPLFLPLPPSTKHTQYAHFQF